MSHQSAIKKRKEIDFKTFGKSIHGIEINFKEGFTIVQIKETQNMLAEWITSSMAN